MDCPNCSSHQTREIPRTTALGYKQFYCRHCRKQFNERTGTPLNFVEYPTEVVMLAVYYYRFKVSLDDVVELMATRGIHLSHQTTGSVPHQLTTDKEPALYPAVKEVFGTTGIHLGSIGIAAVYVGSLSRDGGRSTGVCCRKPAPNHFKRLLFVLFNWKNQFFVILQDIVRKGI